MAAALEDSFHVLPAHRRDRRDGRQGLRGRAGGLRAAPGPRRLHPELHRPRDAAAEQLAETAREIFGEDRVIGRAALLPDAIDQAAALAEAGEAFGDALGSGAVLVTGSVVTVGEARRCSGPVSDASPEPHRPPTAALPAARHVRRGAEPRGDHPRPHHPGDGVDRRRAPRHGALGRARPRRRLPAAGRDAAQRVGLRAGWAIQVGGDRARLRGPDDVRPGRDLRRCCGAPATSSAARSSASARRRTPPTTVEHDRATVTHAQDRPGPAVREGPDRPGRAARSARRGALRRTSAWTPVATRSCCRPCSPSISTAPTRAGRSMSTGRSPPSGCWRRATRQSCVTITEVDGLVVARSGFESSMNYRTAVVIGEARVVDDADERQHALDLMVDHMVPGRAATSAGRPARSWRPPRCSPCPCTRRRSRCARAGPTTSPTTSR